MVGGLLSGKTVGIIGCGNVGKDLIRLLQPFGCSILAHDIVNYQDFYQQYEVEPVALQELLQRSDIITLHVPLDADSAEMIQEPHFAMMQAKAILINTARGGLVDEVALKKALVTKQIAAAAFYVFVHEPPEDGELLNHPNFLVTPHIGGSAAEAILAMGRAAFKSLEVNAIPSL